MTNRRPLLLLFALLLSIAAQAQNIRVSETSTLMDKTNMNVAAVEIDAPRERVEEILIDYLEDRYSIDMDKKDKDKSYVTWQADQVDITALNNGKIDLWAKVAAMSDTRTNVMLAASKGYDNSISSANDDRGYRNLEIITENFSTYFYQKYYNNQVEVVNDKVKEVVDNRDDLTKESAKLTKDIANKEEEIVKLQKEIEEAKQQIAKNEEKLLELEPRIELLKTEQSAIQTKAQQWGEPIDPKKMRKRRKRSK